MTSVLQYAIDALSLGSLYALLALGIALIYGIMQLINFAHGELLMIGGYALFLSASVTLPVSLAVTLLAVVGAAVAMDRVAFRPVRGADPSTLLVTSFAVSYLLQNLAILIFGARAKSVNLSTWLSGPIAIGDLRVARISLVVIAATGLLLVAVVAFLRRTTVGVQMRAAAEDFTMTRLLGVRANVVVGSAFALSGALAGVATILLVAQTGTLEPTMGLTPVIVAFVATIIGGLGSLVGAVAGGFALGVLTTVLQAALPESLRPYRDAFVFAGVILLLLARPEGLVPNRAQVVRV